MALSWSPLGLAKHKRSALAVLTTNQVLSLWASNSDPKVASSWERVLIINKALEIFYQQVPSNSENGLPAPNILRPLCCVRSMSWALPKVSDSSKVKKNHLIISPSESSALIQFLAVTNDADEVVILQVKSPWMDRESLAWEAKPVYYAHWKNLKLLLTQELKTSGMEIDDSTMSGAELDQWPSVFATSMKRGFIESVACIPCQNEQANLALILRKDRQVLRFDIFHGVSSGSSTIDKWMPLSFPNKMSSSNIYVPSLGCGCAIFQEKVFRSFQILSHCIDSPRQGTVQHTPRLPTLAPSIIAGIKVSMSKWMKHPWWQTKLLEVERIGFRLPTSGIT